MGHASASSKPPPHGLPGRLKRRWQPEWHRQSGHARIRVGPLLLRRLLRPNDQSYEPRSRRPSGAEWVIRPISGEPPRFPKRWFPAEQSRSKQRRPVGS
jgi:hypothetical protein